MGASETIERPMRLGQEMLAAFTKIKCDTARRGRMTNTKMVGLDMQPFSSNMVIANEMFDWESSQLQPPAC